MILILHVLSELVFSWIVNLLGDNGNCLLALLALISNLVSFCWNDTRKEGW